MNRCNLVGGDWNMTFILPYTGVIIPVDELILFRGVQIKPPTSCECIIVYPSLHIYIYNIIYIEVNLLWEQAAG